MISVFTCIATQHDWRFLAAAVLICVIGSGTTIFLLARIEDCHPAHRNLWMAAAGAAAGLAIWSTHFLSMLAYDGGLPISYNPGITTLSVIVAVSASWAAIRIALLRPSIILLAAGGLALGIGVAAMHFMGMLAIEAQARIDFDVVAVGMAILIGSTLGALAFVAYGLLAGYARLIVPTILLVLAIASLHFTSMSAIRLVPDPGIAPVAIGIDRALLAGMVVTTSTLLILFAGVAMVLDRLLTDLRGLADASLEGLLIVHGDTIIDVNERLARLVGAPATTFLGKSLTTLLTLDDDELACRTERAPSEATLMHDGGRHVAVEILCRNIEYRGRECHVIAIRDLTEKKEAERRLAHLASHDGLTDLANRTLFDERVAQALARARRDGSQVAMFALDLDRFKAVNDIFGHAAGDATLRKVADLLRAETTRGDTVARLGGDEFAILQTGQVQPQGARALADRLLAAFARDMDTGRNPVAVGVSIGIALSPNDGLDAVELRANADTALYRAKASGRGVASFFDADMDDSFRRRRMLEHDLRHAILRRQLAVVYQPLVDARSGVVAGYEALLRWDHPLLGPIAPGVFIPIAEDSGSIVQLGQWVLDQACAEAVAWPDPLTVAVNVSPVQFQLASFYGQIAGALTRSGLPGNRLELEITESALLKDRIGVLSVLHRLRALGVRIVMDDFGTGYSSLSNLQSFPFDKIKIDGSFTAALETDPAARSIVTAIIGLGHSLNLPVVTEGVETERQHAIVVEQGCAQVQGFLTGRPGPGPRFAEGAATQRSA